jgi:hypothetical protein
MTSRRLFTLSALATVLAGMTLPTARCLLMIREATRHVAS